MESLTEFPKYIAPPDPPALLSVNSLLKLQLLTALSKYTAPPLYSAVLFMNLAFILELESFPLKYIAPPLSDFPFLKVRPVIFMLVAVTVQIWLFPAALKIASALPYFMKFKFLSIVNFIFPFPVYSPDAIITVSPLLALFSASVNVLTAVASVFPSPLEVLLALTYQLFPAVNTSSLDTFNVLLSNSLLATLLSIDNKLFSMLTDSSIDNTFVLLVSAALADEINTSEIKNIDKTISIYLSYFIIYPPFFTDLDLKFKVLSKYCIIIIKKIFNMYKIKNILFYTIKYLSLFLSIFCDN